MANDSPKAAALPRTRGYQQEMLDASLRRNIVIAMDTGSGKTHIAVLRMKIEAEREQKKLSWFLAPTVGLCEQQRDVIKSSLPVTVGLISGALEPDQWKDPQLWKDALATHRIIVSTPQVLLDALRHGYVRLGRDVGLLVFDEAHHAADKHPYNMIMREFYDVCSPRSGAVGAPQTHVRPFVLGLTASPIFGGNVDKAFLKIETNLDSVILSPRNTRSELAKHVHRPAFKHILYPPISEAPDPSSVAPNVRSLTEVAGTLVIENDPFVQSMRQKLKKQTVGSPEHTRTDQRLSRAIDKKDTFTHQGIRDFSRTARELCDDLGPWAADWYVQNVVQKALKNTDSMHLFFAERNHKERVYLVGILRRIQITAVSYDPAQIVSGCSQKAKNLISCLLHEKTEWEALEEVYSGIVFVTRRDAVLALAELLSHHPLTKDIFSIGSLLGNSDSARRNAFLDITRALLKQTQSETLADFRIGEKNLIISTAVAEEGIDIQACGSVVRWDLPQNMVSWAQSRGRARRKRSSFVLMFENGGTHSAQIKKWEALEAEMVQKYIDEQRHLKVLAAKEEDEEDENEYREFRVPETGAVVTLNSAVSHLAHFCNVLPSDSRVDNQPVYDIDPPDYPEGFHSAPDKLLLTQHLGPFSATVTLPRLLPPDQRVYATEKVHKTKQSARRHAAFQAYVALYHAGLLGDNLLPLSSSLEPLREEEVQKLLKDIEKREGMASVREQMNPWDLLVGSMPGSQWWMNELIIEGVSTFRLLTRVEMPKLDFRETLHDPEFGPRQVTIRAGNQASLPPDDILAARHFTRRVCSVFYGSRLKWDDLNFSYLFLPPVGFVDRVWTERREWAEETRLDRQNMSALQRVVINAGVLGNHYSYPKDIFLLREISGWGNTYFRFIRWRHEKLSSDEEELLLKRYAKFENVEISYPVIIGRPLRNRMNFLVPLESDAEQLDNITILPQFTAIVLENETNVKLSLFLPSILRAAFIKMIASSLQNSLLKRVPELQEISLDLIKTALTAPAAGAHYNYQRLETLGDTILKFITGIQLLAEHPHWPEGFLTKRKDHAVSNACLAKSAINKNLYKWIIRKVFLVRKWKPDYSRNDLAEVILEDDSVEEISDADEVTVTGDTLNGEEKASDASPNPVQKLSTKTLADVVESLIGAAYLSGGFDCSIACADAFDIGIKWQPVKHRVSAILNRVEQLPDPPTQLAYPESMLGYTFKRKLLLIEALMHASCQSDYRTFSYERMEFLGDSVLDVVVNGILFHAEGKDYSPGQMQIRKAALVNTHFLAYICLKTYVMLDAKMPKWEAARGTSITTEKQAIHLWQCLFHSSHRILDEQADTFARYLKNRAEIERAFECGVMYPWGALTRLQAPKFLSDIVESTLGAVYLDSRGDMQVVEQVLEKLGILSILRRVIRDNVDIRHPVSRVANWAAKRQKENIEYNLSRAKGQIRCELVVDGELVTTATERYNGKSSQDEVRFRAAEEGIEILIKKYGEEQEDL